MLRTVLFGLIGSPAGLLSLPVLWFGGQLFVNDPLGNDGLALELIGGGAALLATATSRLLLRDGRSWKATVIMAGGGLWTAAMLIGPLVDRVRPHLADVLFWWLIALAAGLLVVGVMLTASDTTGADRLGDETRMLGLEIASWGLTALWLGLQFASTSVPHLVSVTLPAPVTASPSPVAGSDSAMGAGAEALMAMVAIAWGAITIGAIALGLLIAAVLRQSVPGIRKRLLILMALTIPSPVLVLFMSNPEMGVLMNWIVWGASATWGLGWISLGQVLRSTPPPDP
jgi:hypothetical protein